MVNVPTGDILKLPDVPASQFQVSETALGAVILVGLVSVLVRTMAAYPDRTPSRKEGSSGHFPAKNLSRGPAQMPCRSRRLRL